MTTSSVSNPKLSERIRLLLTEQYVRPALQAGRERLSVRVRDVLNDLPIDEVTRNRTPVICQVLLSDKFPRDNNLEIVSVDGPPSKRSPTVVVHYRFLSPTKESYTQSSSSEQVVAGELAAKKEDSAAWARRVTGKMAGLLKEELAAYGGGDAFMKWIRSDGEDGE